MGWKFGPTRLGAALLEPAMLLRFARKRAAA